LLVKDISKYKKFYIKKGIINGSSIRYPKIEASTSHKKRACSLLPEATPSLDDP
tara:strand:+ start:242 stop:403 length:162 start_codon:yes stop_codon:yes gene_type:complete